MMDQKKSELDKLLSDPVTSFWLKAALRSALTRDPLDAERDAGTLYLVLRCRAEQALTAEVKPRKTCPHLRGNMKADRNG
jgi:hypothetical protein